MIDLLQTITALVVALSILIAIHEYGHFWVAKRLGVKVMRFSIGFGQPIWRWMSRDGETEYVVAAIPLGGYVKMLDEREGPIAVAELPRAFNRRPVGHRCMIVVAGPLFNFIFAVFAYWVMFVVGVPGMKAVVGEVTPDTPAYYAGLRTGMTIIEVDHEATPTWKSAIDRLLPHLVLRERVEIAVESNGSVGTHILDFTRLTKQALEPDDLMLRAGLAPYTPLVAPVLDRINPGSPAEQAGLRTGDRIVAINSEPLNDWFVLVREVQQSTSNPLRLTVERGSEQFQVTVIPQMDETGKGGRIGASVKFDHELFAHLRAELSYSPFHAINKALIQTGEMSLLTLRVMWEIVAGRASTKNISGPVTIAQFAKQSASAGISYFLGFLALVSLSLGVLNLLPVPMLDGGHLLFYLVEIVKGKPVSEQTEIVAQRIGLFLIAALMSLALYNDFMRLVG